MLIAETIAEAFADNPFHAQDMAEDAANDLGFGGPWLRSLAARIKSQIDGGMAIDRRGIRAAILVDTEFQALFDSQGRDVPVPAIFSSALKTRQKRQAPRWQVPLLESFGEIAELLKMDWSELQWLVGNRNNYHRRWIRKRSSGLRLIESPRPLLKSIQRKILRLILNQVPVHDSSHGFCRGRNVVSFAQLHVGQACVMKFDLKNFFPTLRFGRVVGLFKSLGYLGDVARVLAKLCTTHCPPQAIEDLIDVCTPSQLQELRKWYLPAHLPQGAPCSPMLANLCVFRLDSRLAGFANAHGGGYSRYADDLVISGSRKMGRNYEWIASVVGAIVLEEGFELNYRKSRLMKSSTRQHSTGVVLNSFTNIPRDKFDRLKATLHNCLRYGPLTQNRELHPDFQAHLAGKIAWVTQLNPRRGAKLKRLYDQIRW